MSSSASTGSISASFGQITVAVSDGYFMVEPAEAVVVSANSHLRTATGGAHDVTRIAGSRVCCEPVPSCCRGIPGRSSRKGSAWLTGGRGEEFNPHSW